MKSQRGKNAGLRLDNYGCRINAIVELGEDRVKGFMITGDKSLESMRF